MSLPAIRRSSNGACQQVKELYYRNLGYILVTPFILSVETTSFFVGVAGYNSVRRRADCQDFNEHGLHPLTRCLQCLSDTDIDARDFPTKTKGSGVFFSRNFFSVPRPSGGVNFLTPQGAEGKKSTGSLVGKIRVSSFVSGKAWQRVRACGPIEILPHRSKNGTPEPAPPKHEKIPLSRA